MFFLKKHLVPQLLQIIKYFGVIFKRTVPVIKEKQK